MMEKIRYTGRGLFLCILVLLQCAGATRQLQQCDSCVAPIKFVPNQHKPIKYSIGVLAIKGVQTAIDQYQSTFADYLTATAGKRFDPPIEFEMTILDFQTMYDYSRDQVVHFSFVNPSAAACIEAQYGTQSLASIITAVEKDGKVYELSEFAGLIIARKENSEINFVTDLKDKVVGAVSISGFGAALLQFHEMIKAGMSYINDPSELIFTRNQQLIVKGVLDGTFDAGFVRTGLIEKVKDAGGNPVNASELKIINPRSDELGDGYKFPYQYSTPLYPEWNLFALKHTPSDVSREVQAALLALAEHARTGRAMEACAQNSSDAFACSNIQSLDPLARCDVTVESARAASKALSDGSYAGWRTTLSYSGIHGLLQDTGMLRKDPETSEWRCLPPSDLYQQIVCPDGFIKRSYAAYASSCASAGLTCPDGYECVCRPCFEANEIEVAPAVNYTEGVGCSKMSTCGIMEQLEVLTLTIAVFNGKEPDFRAYSRVGIVRNEIPVEKGTQTNTYSLDVSTAQAGVLIVEIFDGDNHIASSPLLFDVVYRTCPDPDSEVADEQGNCVCSDNHFEIFNECYVRMSVNIGFIAAPILVVFCCVLCCLYAYIRKQKQEANKLFMVKPRELEFSDPPVIIGRGSFGFVLLARYRGSKVAVKRVLPPREIKRISTFGLKVNRLFGYAKNDHMDSRDNTTEAKTIGDIEAGRRDSMGPKDSTTHSQGRASSTQSSNPSLDELVMRSPGSIPRTKLGHCDSLESMENNLVSPRTNLRKVESMEIKEIRVASDVDEDEEVLANFEGGGNQNNLRRFSASSTGTSTSAETTASNDHRDTYLGQFLRRRRAGSAAVTEKNIEKLEQEFLEEMRFLARLRHPNITTVMGAVIEKGSDPILIMEYMDHGSLHECLLNPTFILEADLELSIMKDIAQGVRYLHSSKPAVIHGNLNSGNVLIDSKFRAKLAGFDLSRRGPSQTIDTTLWMAPELLLGVSSNTVTSDMYSVGVILWEILARKDPYADSTDSYRDLLRTIIDPKKNRRPRIPKSCHIKLKKLIKFLWHADPTLRPTASELDNRLAEMDESMFATDTSYRLSRKQSGDQDSFLYQAFPRHIADVLKGGGKVEAENHENVTIFFSDIVGFTTIASKFAPMKVSQMLDRLYLKLDELSREHKLFKIETIGDAYMCAGNLEKDQDHDHVKRIASFALGAVDAASKTLVDEEDPSRGYLTIRVGFHTGPVVSNVVGSLNPRYGLFGDTVNSASRMESTSEEGRIHCSEASALLLMKQAADIPLTLRGETPIKGKGKMTTYWVH